MSVSKKLNWDAECDATRAGLERFLRALVCTRSHFTDSFTLAPIDKPCRVSVFFRVWIPEGMEQRFLTLAGLAELKPPPRVQLDMDPPAGPLRHSVFRDQ